MLTVPALKVQQFRHEFFLLNLAAADVERLVRFEVLGDVGLEGASGRATARRRAAASSLVNWAEIEKKIQTTEKAFQRPILRKKVDELAEHYKQCRDDGGVPAIPGAVLLTTDEPVEFTPAGANPFVGLVQMSEREGALRVLDGQHRLLALAAVRATDPGAVEGLQVPAILFAGLPPPAVVEMFVIINSKHTRLNASLLFELKGRRIYVDPLDAAIHDAIKALNDRPGSPLQGEIKMLGVGKGRVTQAGLAQEMRDAVQRVRDEHPSAQWRADLEQHLDRFYEIYFREVHRVFADIWESKKHSIRSTIALRAFVQASPPVMVRVGELGGDPRSTVRQMLAPWTTRIGPERFETARAWREKAAGGGKETTRLLARELVAALGEVSG